VAVVAGMDRQITHDKIKIAIRQIFQGADFIATNIDGTFPTDEGLNPGTGMVIGALAYTAERKPIIVGKPETAIFEAALSKMKANRESTIMVGDKLTTDILGAQRAGITSVDVLSGVTTKEILATSEIQPDYVFDDLAAITAAMKGS
jgi:4-nitrophenyl phosphatase